MQQVVLLGDDGDYPIDQDSGVRKPKTREEIIVWQQARKEEECKRGKARSSQSRAAEATYRAMGRLAYSLVPEGHSGLREALTCIHNDWTKCLQRDEDQTIGKANKSFASRPNDPGWGGDDLSQEVLEELAKPFYLRTRDALRERLNDRQRRLFELGERIEEGLCPTHVHCHLRRDDGAPLTVREGPSHSGPSDAEEDTWDDESARPPEEPTFRLLADVERQPGELEPDREWYGELETVWQRAQFPLDCLHVIRELAKRHADGLRLDRNSVAQAVSELHAYACTTLTDQPGYLGIAFDFDGRSVKRTGFDKPVDLTPLLGKLFRCLHEAEGELVPRKSLQECWDDIESSERLDEIVTPSSFDPAITRLRKRLGRIGLNVERVPSGTRQVTKGFRLVSKPTTSSSSE
jgi:DNA-binding winged helix-turn-helix (wHTH) protein